jgi:hypothetical protein
MNFVATQGYSINDLSTDNVFDGETHTRTEIIDLSGSGQGPGFVLARRLGVDPSQVRAATATEKAALSGVTADLVVVLGTDFDLNQVQSGGGQGESG